MQNFGHALVGTCIICLGALLTQSPACAQEDPWPMRQRTATRLGNTTTIGPRTPTIGWRIRLLPDESCAGCVHGNAPVMDSGGTIYIGHYDGLAAIDPKARKVIWQFQFGDSIDYEVALYKGRLLFGSPNDYFYCVDAETGKLIWRHPANSHPNRSAVVDDNGIVYYNSQVNPVYARRVSDGELLWTAAVEGKPGLHLALDRQGRWFTGGLDATHWSGYRTSDGARLWRFGEMGFGTGFSPVLVQGLNHGRVYVAQWSPAALICLDLASGQKIWSVPFTRTATSCGPIGLDGTVYLSAGDGPTAMLYAVTPDGKEKWRYPVGEMVLSPPIIDGTNTLYVPSTENVQRIGHLHAVRSDGTPLWVKAMPRQMGASPMLAPDGTLYVLCSDKHLYAFRDLRGDLNCDGVVDFADIDPFVLALSDPAAYQQQYPNCNLLTGDCNEDGTVDFADIDPFVALLSG